MSELALRTIERIHGHLGWLAAAGLLHPAIFLRRKNRRAVLSASLSTLAITAAVVLGIVLYPEYRATLKQPLFVKAPTSGWMFERKEHLAVAALAFAWVGLVAHVAAPRFPRPTRPRAERLAHVAFVVSFALTVAVGVLGVVVSVHTSF